MKKFAQVLTHLSVDRPWSVVAGGALVSLVGGYYTALLFMNLRPDIEELLPETAPSVIGLTEVRNRLRSTDNFVVLMQSTNDQPLPRALAEELAAAMAKIPPEFSAGVEYKISRELDFFNRRRLLFLDIEDLEQVSRYVRNKIEYEIKLYNPLNIFSGEEIPEPRLNLQEIEKKYSGQMDAFSRMPGGYYASRDEKLRAVMVGMPSGGNSMSTAFALRREIDRVIAEVDLKKKYPGFEYHFAGAGQDLIEEFEALIKDVGIATIVVLILTIGVVVGYFRSWRGTLALLLALAVGALVCFGLSFFLVGYMNANSAFMGSIVIGNGINVGVICLARYYEERRKGVRHGPAVYTMIASTTVATLTAALAAGLAYGSLMATSFRGFSQFGVIGFVGMVSCWTCTMLFLPVFLTLIYGKDSDHSDFTKQPQKWVVAFLAKGIERFPMWIAAAAVGVSAALVVVVATYRGDILETDLTKLRDRDSMEHGSGHYAQVASVIFGQSQSPMVILAHSQADARRMTEILRERVKKDGKASLISDVKNIDDFLPKNQASKQPLIASIDRALTRRVRQALSGADRALVENVLGPEVFQTVAQKDLPALIIGKFTEKSGAVGNLVLIYPAEGVLTWRGDQLIQFVEAIREAGRQVDVSAPVAGQLAVSADLISSIWKDGPKATALAFGAVILLVLLIFRDLRASGLVLMSLILGVLWLTALIAFFKIKINFMNFIALPITFGIGVDYGVNVFERLKQEGTGQIVEVIESTGGAVILASLTTIIGYASLLLAGNMAFVSFGQIAILGEVTCVVAAVVVVPSFMVYLARMRKPKRA